MHSIKRNMETCQYDITFTLILLKTFWWSPTMGKLTVSKKISIIRVLFSSKLSPFFFDCNRQFNVTLSWDDFSKCHHHTQQQNNLQLAVNTGWRPDCISIQRFLVITCNNEQNMNMQQHISTICSTLTYARLNRPPLLPLVALSCKCLFIHISVIVIQLPATRGCAGQHLLLDKEEVTQTPFKYVMFFHLNWPVSLLIVNRELNLSHRVFLHSPFVQWGTLR